MDLKEQKWIRGIAPHNLFNSSLVVTFRGNSPDIITNEIQKEIHLFCLVCKRCEIFLDNATSEPLADEHLFMLGRHRHDLCFVHWNAYDANKRESFVNNFQAQFLTDIFGLNYVHHPLPEKIEKKEKESKEKIVKKVSEQLSLL